MKQVWITNEAYEQVRKIAYDQHIAIGKVISTAILNGVKQ